jgi:uncharacterized protein YegL
MNGAWISRMVALTGAGLLLAACVDDRSPTAPRLDTSQPSAFVTVLSNGFGTVAGDKTVSDDDLFCDGSTTVTITLTGETGIAGEPADIMLALDRSGSMAGDPLVALKGAAAAFVDIIDEATADVPAGQESRIGVVSFAGTASDPIDQELTTDFDAVRTAIDALVAGGGTNHQDAFDKAQEQFTVPGRNIIIMFTDGVTTAGGDPDAAAAAAKAAGTEIFVIGLEPGPGFPSLDVAALHEWASSPDHVFIAPDADELEEIFEAIGAAIVAPADQNVVVTDVVHSDFSVSDIVVTKGIATLTVATNTIVWQVGELGTETVTLSYTATHDPDAGAGIKEINESIVYAGDAGHVVVFPDPAVTVRCPTAMCMASTNPAGKTPEAPGQGGQGQNQDGFYQLLGEDGVGGEVEMFVIDTGTGTVFGPYEPGTIIKYTQAPGAPPRETRIGSDSGEAGAVTVHIIGQGDAQVIAVDSLGQESEPAVCLVPPPPM